MAAFLAIAALGAGYSSTPKTDWNGRIGAYTHDAAVREMGPADRSA